MAIYYNGQLQPERAHSPRECEVECRDCFEFVGDVDEEYCCGCGEPLCLDCQRVVADEPLCAKCFAASQKVALGSLQNDFDVADLFWLAA
jgi:hypothetical protein